MSATYGEDKFILYKESSNDTELDVGWGTNFPTDVGEAYDTAVAWVTYTQDTVVMQNS